MNSAGKTAIARSPWDWFPQGPIDFESTHPIAEVFQFAAISSWQLAAGDLEELTRRDVQEHSPRLRKLFQRLDQGSRNHLAAQRFEIRDHCVGQLPRPTARKRPARRVTCN